MANFDLSIRNKLSLFASAGVILVAGMLVNEQIGDQRAARQRAEADSEQLAAVEALRAADDARSMQIETREMRLAIVPSEVDRALYRLQADQASAAEHIETALNLTNEPADKERLHRLAELVKAYAAVGGQLAKAAKDHSDTADKEKRTGGLGDGMNALIERTTAALIEAAQERKEQADTEKAFVSRLDLGIGLFITVLLGLVSVFGAVAISRPIHRIGAVLRQLARRQQRHRRSLYGAPRRGRRRGARRAGLQGKTHPHRTAGGGREGDGAPLGRTAPRRHAGARQHLRGNGRHDRAIGVVVIGRA